MELSDIEAEEKEGGENVGHEIINTGDGSQLINEPRKWQSQNKNNPKFSFIWGNFSVYKQYQGVFGVRGGIVVCG